MNMLIASFVLWMLGSIHNSCQIYERASGHIQILQQGVPIPFLMGSLLFVVGAILNSRDKCWRKVLKPFVVPRFHIWKITDKKSSQRRRHQPWLWKIYNIFIFATDFHFSNRREFLQTPSHPFGKEFVTSIDFNMWNIGRVCHIFRNRRFHCRLLGTIFHTPFTN